MKYLGEFKVERPVTGKLKGRVPKDKRVGHCRGGME